MRSERWLRIIPVAFIMYTIAFIDRTNISLALPSMARELHMTSTQAGDAAGIFFWGYLLLQIPGGHLAQRWSAKRFVSILLVLWGVCSVGCGLVRTTHEFWIMRFLLGVAEGGVWPATLVLLSHWFPRPERARANAYWMLCLPVAVIVSSPVSGWILGRWNWRVLLIAEGLPASCGRYPILEARSAVDLDLMSDPSTQIRPESGRSKPLISLSSVVLPLPFLPISAVTTPE